MMEKWRGGRAVIPQVDTRITREWDALQAWVRHSVVMMLVTDSSIGQRSVVAARGAVLLRAVLELAIAGCVFVVYRAGRLVTNDSIESATSNAHRVLEAQGWLTGSPERAVQQVLLDVPGSIDFLNYFYVFVHFPATVMFLVWVFVRRRDQYAPIRNWFVGVTMSAMVVHVMFPLAPPRMLDGYVDTLREYGPSIYPEDPSRSLANQFAAMPSLHFGWALMVAVGAIAFSTGPRRWWWLAHPAVTLLAIVATGNHYVLDAAVAALIAAVVGLLVVRRRDVRVTDDVRLRASHLVAGDVTARAHLTAAPHEVGSFSPSRRPSEQPSHGPCSVKRTSPLRSFQSSSPRSAMSLESGHRHDEAHRHDETHRPVPTNEHLRHDGHRHEHCRLLHANPQVPDLHQSHHH